MTSVPKTSLPGNMQTAPPDRYLIVIGVFLAMMVAGIIINCFGVFFKPVSTQFGWTRAETAGAFSLSLIIGGLAGIVAGEIGDRFSQRSLIVICGVFEGAAYLLLAHLSTLWQLYLYYGLLVGLGMANMVPASSLITRWYKKRRGLMTGVALSGFAFGAVITPPIATHLISSYSWSTSYTIIGGVALGINTIAAVILYLSARVKKPPEEFAPAPLTTPPANVPPDSPIGKINSPTVSQWRLGLTFQAAVRSRQFWYLSIILFCANFAQQAVSVHIIPHVSDLGFSAAGAALILTITNGMSAIGNFSVGSANDRFGGRTSLIFSISILLISLVILLFANSLWVFYLFAVIFGMAWGGTATLRSALIAELFGLRAHGSILGVIILLAMTGGTVGPLIAGYIFDASGQYTLVFLLINGIVLIGLAVAVLLKYRAGYSGSRLDNR
jgi:MFS family permease